MERSRKKLSKEREGRKAMRENETDSRKRIFQVGSAENGLLESLQLGISEVSTVEVGGEVKEDGEGEDEEV